MRVYLDGVMLLNFLVDYLLLLGTNRLTGFPLDGKRLALASGLGALYSGMCVLHSFRFMGNLFWRTVCLALMALVAFGWNRSAWKRGSVFVILSMALGGLAVSIGRQDFVALVLGALLFLLLCGSAFGAPIGQREYVNAELQYGQNRVRVVALRDTGNGLRDPVTGEPVLVVSAGVAWRLTGLSREQLRCPLQTMAAGQIPGLRLIPYRSVGNSGGMLLALPMTVCVSGRSKRVLTAFAPDGIGEEQMYQALTGGTFGI